ncbi:transposable element Tcb2 transposase [Trichonephila clavipes]|nr:transposable element Tcb2 transposase [Trichonephila clavipes]
MKEDGWSAWRVTRQFDRSDCVMNKCWDQWIREMSFTRSPGSDRPQQTSRQEDRHITPGLGAFGIAAPIPCVSLGAHPSTPPFGEAPRPRKLDCSGMKPGRLFKNESRFSLINYDNRVHVWRLRRERLNPAYTLQRHTAATASVMVWGTIA